MAEDFNKAKDDIDKAAKERKKILEEEMRSSGHVSMGDYLLGTTGGLVKYAPDSVKGGIEATKRGFDKIKSGDLEKKQEGMVEAATGAANVAVGAIPTVIAGSIGYGASKNIVTGLKAGEGITKVLIKSPLKALWPFGGALGGVMLVGAGLAHLYEQDTVSANAKSINALLDERSAIMKECIAKYGDRIKNGESLASILAAEDTETFKRLNALNERHAQLTAKDGWTTLATDSIGDMMRESAEHMEKVGGFFGTIGGALSRTIGAVSDGLTYAGEKSAKGLVYMKNVATGKDMTYDKMLSDRSDAEKMISMDIDKQIRAMMVDKEGGFGPMNNGPQSKLVQAQLRSICNDVGGVHCSPDNQKNGVEYKGKSVASMTARDHEVADKLNNGLNERAGKLPELYDGQQTPRVKTPNVAQPSLG